VGRFSLRENPEGRERYERRVRELTQWGDRGAATEREYRAAEYLVGELQGLGLSAEVEGFWGYRSSGLRLLLHVVCAGVGMGLIWIWPAATIALGTIAFVSLFVEDTTRGTLLSWLIPRSRSANVVARIVARDGKARQRLVLMAHYDSQRTGRMWTDASQRAALRRSARMPAALKSPFSFISLAMLMEIGLGVGMVCGIVRLMPILCGALLLAFVYTAFLLLDWAKGPYVPGASDNGSGVAAVLSLAEMWLAEPVGDVEVMLLFTSCEETGLTGSAAWADRHAKENAALPTVFVNVDGLGFGPPKYLVREVPVMGLHTVAYPTEMIEACRRAVETSGGVAAQPQTMTGSTDGLALLVRGLKGITILGCHEDGYMPNYHQLTDTVERLDFESAWKGTEFVWEVVRELAARKG
jgi:hypothetical protein